MASVIDSIFTVFAELTCDYRMMSHRIEVKRLTARGRGAVAVIRVQLWSDEAREAINQCFVAVNGVRTADAAVGRILYGHWGHEDVVVVRVADHEWEINCHGGDAAVAAICKSLAGLEVSAAVSDKVSHSEVSQLDAELLSVLLKCRTRQTAEFVLAQQQGVLSGFLQSLCECKNNDAICRMIQESLLWEKFAYHLTTPWQIAVVGQPNAGKSSLLNAIVGYERSIVFDQPGTTRDRVEAQVTLDGFPFVLADTAGIRESADEIEAFGVAEARLSIRNCDACLIVVDANVGWTQADTDLLGLVPPGHPVAIIFNKIDLLSQGNDIRQSDTVRADFVLETCALTGVGINELLEWLPETLVPKRPTLKQPLILIGEIADALKAFTAGPDRDALDRALNMWR